MPDYIFLWETILWCEIIVYQNFKRWMIETTPAEKPVTLHCIFRNDKFLLREYINTWVYILKMNL